MAECVVMGAGGGSSGEWELVDEYSLTDRGHARSSCSGKSVGEFIKFRHVKMELTGAIAIIGHNLTKINAFGVERAVFDASNGYKKPGEYPINELCVVSLFFNVYGGLAKLPDGGTFYNSIGYSDANGNYVPSITLNAKVYGMK